jgi:hypothetical protein
MTIAPNTGVCHDLLGRIGAPTRYDACRIEISHKHINSYAKHYSRAYHQDYESLLLKFTDVAIHTQIIIGLSLSNYVDNRYTVQ